MTTDTTGKISWEQAIEAMAVARCRKYCRNDDCLGSDRCWQLSHGNAGQQLRDDVEIELNALSALGLVLTTREVVEAAQAVASRSNFIGHKDGPALQLWRALRAAPDLTGVG